MSGYKMDPLHQQRRQAAQAHLLAHRHQGGLFEGPPAMLAKVSEWMRTVYASQVLAVAEDNLAKLTLNTGPLEANRDEVREFESNLEHIVEKLKPGQSAGVKILHPTRPLQIGVQRDKNPNWPMLWVGFGKYPGRIQYKSEGPKGEEVAVRWLRQNVREHLLALETAIRIYQEQQSSREHSRAGPTREVIAACRKYTTTAQQYKTKATKKFRLDFTGWKYLTINNEVITKLNEKIKADNDRWQENIRDAQEDLQNAQRAYDALVSGKATIGEGLEGIRAFSREYDLANRENWTYNDVIRAVERGERPSPKTTRILEPASSYGVWSDSVRLDKALKEHQRPLIDEGDVKAFIQQSGWDTINCVLFVHQHSRRGGQWILEQRELQVDMLYPYASTVEEFEAGILKIDRTCRHEMQHLGQYLLQLLKGLGEAAGLGPRKTRTPSTTPGGHRTSPEKEVLFGKPRVKHELRDVEFQTDLADAIDHFEQAVARIKKEDRRLFLDLFVGAKPGSPDRHFRVWRQESPEKWREAVKQLTKAIADRDIDMGTSAASRVASRYLRGAITNDPAKLPSIGARVVKVDVGTEDDPMADVYFDDGGFTAVHLHMTPTNAMDSDTEAWQQEALAKLEEEESGKGTTPVSGMARRVAAKKGGWSPYVPPGIYC